MGRKRLVVGGLVAVFACGILGFRWYYQHTRGVEIQLHNVETSPLRALKVTVTGNTYSVGDLGPGATTSVWVKPTSESSVDVSFVTTNGEGKHVPVDTYIESGYSGWISADLTTSEARNIEDHVEVY